MTNNFYDILREVRKSGISWDLETFGLSSQHRAYSSSISPWGTKRPETTFIRPEASDLANASVFGRRGYEKATKAGVTYVERGDFPTRFLSALDKTKFVVGHNLNYDFNTFSREYKEHPLYEKIQAKLQPFTNSQIEALEEAGNFGNSRFFKNRLNPLGGTGISSAMNKDFGHTDYLRAYKKYKNYLSSVLNTEGRVGVLDTQILTKMMAGLAEQGGLVSWGGTPGMGSKLEYLASSIGIDTSGAHGEMDTVYNQPVAEALMNDIDKLGSFVEERVKSTGSRQPGRMPFVKTISDINSSAKLGLSSDSIRMLSMLKNVESATAKYGQYGNVSLSKYNAILKIENAAVEMQNTGRITSKSSSAEASIFSSEKEMIDSYSKFYSMEAEEVKNIYENTKRSISGRTAQEIDAMMDGTRSIFHSSLFDNLNLKSSSRSPHVANPSSSLKSAIFSRNTAKIIGGVGVAVVAATAYSMFTDSGNKKNLSPIEGLHPGAGPMSVGRQKIQNDTDFGSPLKMTNGISKAFDFVSEALGHFSKTVRANKGLIAATAIPGFAYGWHKGTKEGNISWGQAGSAIALDMADDLLIAGGPILAKRVPFINKLKPLLESPYVEKGGMAFFGFSTGKLAGEILAKSFFSGKDDNFNTIEGLRHGGVAEQGRKRWTDFGSGYQGPNPQLSPEYNNAKDVYRFQQFRASKIGLSEEEMYEYMTQEDPEMSEYVQASASAGTALHEYMQAQEYKQGTIYAHEKLVTNERAGIAGHIDEITNLGVGDIKTVSPQIFREIQKAGKYKPQHYAQVQFYLGTTGQERGYIKYVNRANINQQKLFQFDFNPRYYESLISKVERTRARVLEDISRGRLNPLSLPKAASIETLKEDQENVATPLQMAQSIDEKRRIFKEEMEYLSTIKRGMPKAGAGYDRIKSANSKKIEQSMVSTQGIGLHIHENRNKHGVI